MIPQGKAFYRCHYAAKSGIMDYVKTLSNMISSNGAGIHAIDTVDTIGTIDTVLSTLTPRPVPLEEFLKELHNQYRTLDTGQVADYIPELARANGDWFGICVVLVDGRVFAVGDCKQRFTIQSVSKPFTYGLALDLHGTERVLARVGVEPTGDAFNAIVLDEESGRPYNPMVNAGAIAVTDLIRETGADDPTERLHLLLDGLGRYVGSDDLFVDMATFLSERGTGHRNRAIAHLMRGAGMIAGPLDESLDLYFQQCATLVNCRDLAIMAATLANGGMNPVKRVRAVQAQHVKNILSVMYTCGMYDSAGEWSFRVGLPAKSGVGGGILAVVPGQAGIAVFSPRLDTHGNSVRGIAVCEAISERYGLHLFGESRGQALLEAAG